MTPREQRRVAESIAACWSAYVRTRVRTACICGKPMTMQFKHVYQALNLQCECGARYGAYLSGSGRLSIWEAPD